MTVAICRHRFTADDYQQMGRAGILAEDDRVELINGEVVTMSPIGTRHVAAVNRTTRALVMVVREKAIVQPQGSARLDIYNEPQPDFALLEPRADFYRSKHPGPSDILLLVEIADSSLSYDKEVKGRIYAEMNIREYWLADLKRDVVLCYSEPRDNSYQSVREYRSGDLIAAQALPDCPIPVDDLLATVGER